MAEFFQYAQGANTPKGSDPRRLLGEPNMVNVLFNDVAGRENTLTDNLGSFSLTGVFC